MLSLLNMPIKIEHAITELLIFPSSPVIQKITSRDTPKCYELTASVFYSKIIVHCGSLVVGWTTGQVCAPLVDYLMGCRAMVLQGGRGGHLEEEEPSTNQPSTATSYSPRAESLQYDCPELHRVYRWSGTSSPIEAAGTLPFVRDKQK